MTMTDEDIDFEHRRLCPDGACIGVIGPNGRCKLCGRADDGSVQPPHRADAATASDEGEGEDEDWGDEEGLESAPEDAFDEDRELCPDGTCIGVIGPDGRCKVCGSSARSAGS